MCTRALWRNANGAVIVGRNMDWLDDPQTRLWVLPRGQQRDDAIDGTLTWTSTYGSVVAGQYDMMTSDGINEKGLAAHLLWLAESDYGVRDPKRPALSASVWLQHMLDRFATVAEAVAWMEETQVQVVTLVDPFYGKVISLHLALEDATGDSAIVEYLDGVMTIHHDRAYVVMTNSPPYAEQLENVRRYSGFGGSLPLPGSTEANDRFVRAAFYLERLPQPKSQGEAIAAILSVMRNTAQPFGAPDHDRPNISTTVWRTAADLTNGLYVYESCFRPNVIWTNLAALDFSEGAPSRRLDVSGDGTFVGDVTGLYEPMDTLQFLKAGGEATVAS